MLDYDFIPAAKDQDHRLMVVLHGLGDSLEGYRWLPEELNLPWLNYLLVNAPDPYYTGFSWFDFPGDPTPGAARSYRLLSRLLDEWREKGYPTGKTVLFGFSQGCLMTWETGLRYGHRLAGCVGISGLMSDPKTLFGEKSPVALEQSYLITHGRFDPLIPFAEAKKQVQCMQAAGMRVEWHEFDKAHTIAGEAELAVIREFVRRCFGEAA